VVIDIFLLSKGAPKVLFLSLEIKLFFFLSNDLRKVDSNFFCYAATVLSPHRNVLIFTLKMHKPTRRPFKQ